MISRCQLALLLVGATILFTVPALMKDLWRPDEPRYAEVAREMMQTGNYLVPHVNGEVYREKPPLLFWLMALASWPVGTVTAFTARIPSIVAALVILALTFDAARRMFGDRAGLWSAVILATSYRFWWQSNIGQIDMLLTACTTISLYSLWRWFEDRQGVWAFGFYAGAALGLLAKGPPALVTVALGAVVFLWGKPDARRPLRLWAGLPLTLVPALVWFLLARSAAGGAVSKEVSGTFTRQIVERMVEGVSHPHAPWYYITSFPVEWFPWSVFIPWTVVHAWRTRHEGPGTRLVLSWTIPALIFFHLIVEKRHVYILPLYPGFAMLTARSVIALMDEGRVAWLRASAVFSAVVLLALATMPVSLQFVPIGMEWDGRLIPLAFAGTVSSIWLARIVRARAWNRWPAALAAQTAAVFLTCGIGAFPVMNDHKSAEAFCEPVRSLSTAGEVDVYNVGPLREEYLFYTNVIHNYIFATPGLAALPNSDESPATISAREARAEMANACAKVAVDSNTEPSALELIALGCARDQALAKAVPPGGNIPAYNAIVGKEVAEFMDTLRGEEPAVVFVQEADWRWILSFAPAPSFLTVLKDEEVAERDMLLFANPAGVQTLRKANYPASLLPFEQSVSMPGE